MKYEGKCICVTLTLQWGLKHQVRPTDNRSYILSSFTVIFSITRLW